MFRIKFRRTKDRWLEIWGGSRVVRLIQESERGGQRIIALLQKRTNKSKIPIINKNVASLTR